MLIALDQLGQLFIFMIAGYILGKSRLIKPEQARVLSVIGVYVFFPCTTFKAFSRNFNAGYLSEYYPLMLVSIAILAVLIAFSYFGAKLFAKEGYENKVYQYSLIVPNFGYMGYALAEGLYGAQGLLNIIFFGLPISIYIYTYGYAVLTKKEISLKKLLNPPIIAMLIGALLGLLEVSLPNFIVSAVDKSAGCMAPVSMVLAGLTISEFNIRDLVSDKKAYIMCALRLIIIPLAILFVLKPFCSESIVRTAVLLYAMPCGMNTIVFPKLVGEDCHIGARLAFVSSVLCIITIPIILSLI